MFGEASLVLFPFRLSNEPGVPELVLELNGIQRLVQLSRQEKERNYSDGVLIACLVSNPSPLPHWNEVRNYLI